MKKTTATILAAAVTGLFMGGTMTGCASGDTTITAAEMLGVSDRVGSIEVGKDADLIVLDGNPFDYRTFVDLTFVKGKLL